MLMRSTLEAEVHTRSTLDYVMDVQNIKLLSLAEDWCELSGETDISLATIASTYGRYATLTQGLVTAIALSESERQAASSRAFRSGMYTRQAAAWS